MKASRAAIRTAKAVAEMVAQMVTMDVRMAKLEKAFHRLAAEVTAVEKPPEPTTEEKSRVRAVRKRGGA